MEGCHATPRSISAATRSVWKRRRWCPDSRPAILASDREVTRLGESVFRSGRGQRRGPEGAPARCWRGWRTLYRKLDVVGVRAVATSAIRDTRNQAEFLARASEAAGTQVEIISGREEARLIHLGVESDWPQARQAHSDHRYRRRQRGDHRARKTGNCGRRIPSRSAPCGCARFSSATIRRPPRQMHQMQRIHPGETRRRPCAGSANRQWDRVIATSATAAAVAGAVARLPRSQREEIDRLRVSTAQVRKLYGKIAGLDLAARRKITGIGPRRAEIIVPGVAVLLAFLPELRLPAVYYSRAGVRDGIIADLAARNVGAELSRLNREQRREVEEMARRYGVSLEHARKVAHISSLLFTALQPLHQLPPAVGKLLEAAAYLHDVGHFVSSVAHHKHSYYVVSNSDMPGFTARERLLIAGAVPVSPQVACPRRCTMRTSR